MALATAASRQATLRPTAGRTRCVKVAAAHQPGKAFIASAAAAVLLSSSMVAPPPGLAAVDANGRPTASETAKGPNDKGFFTSLLDAIPSAFPKVKEDPFGADRAQAKTVADTKRPIPIPTEQEAVAPEAFPNPSELRSERPPVLAAAEGDENLGPNAGQFKDLDASGRQALIDKQSPAESSTN